MKDYVRTDVTISPWNEDIADFLAGLLSEIGYESFTTEEPVLTAYILEETHAEESLREVIESFPAPGFTLKYLNSIVEGEDWNHEWEKHYFQPIKIADRCLVRSSFHPSARDTDYEIVVDPKMAFGTGHHSTTRLMLEYLLSQDLRDKSIIDMGTGTGILAILACMRGASNVYGIEIDPDAFVNACDNAKLNGVNPEFTCGDAATLRQLPEVDLMLANINRNIITHDLPAYRNNLHPGSHFICSGFYRPDLDIIVRTAGPLGLQLEEYHEDNGWIRADFIVS